MWRGRPLWAEVDLGAIAHNVREIRRRIGPSPEILAVVKANGYGHGAVPVAKAVLEAGAQRLGVACVDEGIQLRKAGIAAPILIMGYVPAWDAEKVVEHHLTPTVTTMQMALALAAHAKEKGVVTPTHIKIDTGMSRFGIPLGEAKAFAQFLRDFPSLRVEGLYTHFASADEADKDFTWKQFKEFLGVAEALPWIQCRHVANSAAICDLPQMALEMVRPGISLYGCYPSQEVGRSLDLRPALTLKSLVARIQTLSPGDSVSYGRTWVAHDRTRIALIPCGYADGLPRLLSNRGSVLVRGRRSPILGRVTMDQCMVDVTHIPQVTAEDEVVIIGRQGEEEISVEEVAALAETISYEILCGISARVPRVYIKDGRILHVQSLVEEIYPQEPQTFPISPSTGRG